MTAQASLEQRQIVAYNSLGLFVDKPLYLPGERIQGQLQVNLKEPTKVKALDLYFQGVEETDIHGPKGAEWKGRNDIFGKAWRLLSEATLPAGSTNYPFYFDIPVDALASYTGKNASIEWRLSSKAEIGWGHDLSQDLVLRVIRTLNSTSSPIAGENPQAQPKIRVELSADLYQPGETVEGKIVLIGSEKMKEKGVILQLTVNQHASGGGRLSRKEVMVPIAVGSPIEYSRDRLITAKEVPFLMPLPAEAACSYKGALSSVDWSVNAYMNLGFFRSITIEVPFTVEYKTPQAALPQLSR